MKDYFLSRMGQQPLLLLVLLGLIALGTACKKDALLAPPAPRSVASGPGATPPAAPAPGRGGQPQPTLPIEKLWVGTNAVRAEIAREANQIPIGMMWRTNMAEMEGMLFVFPYPQEVAFYMKNTLLPLSCAYIDAEGTILEIYDMTPLDETPIPSRSDQVQYVLEMNQGWFERHQVQPGVVISAERGTLPQVFFRR